MPEQVGHGATALEGHRTGHILLIANLHLQGSKHPRDRLFFLTDEEDVVEDDGSALIARLENQPTRLEQQVFKDVVDFLVDPQVGSGKAFEVAEDAMMMQQFVGSQLPNNRI